MPTLERYLDALEGSWQGLAAGRAGAVVVRTPDLLVLRHPDPVLDNAVLLRPAGLGRALELLADAPSPAVWTAADDAAAAAVVRAAGLRPDTTTTPMVRLLGVPLPASTADVAIEHGADPARVCRRNGVDPDLLSGVPGLRCVMTADDAAGLAVQDVGDDVVLSFVATRPGARGRGLATAVTVAALHGAAARGRRAAVLQATPEARRLYARLGFVAVGGWQEWVRA